MIAWTVVLFCENYVPFVYTSNISDLKSKTTKDAALSKLLVEIRTGKWSDNQQLKAYSGIIKELSVFEGVRRNCIVVLQLLQKQILKIAHETHQGIVKTKRFLRARFSWPSMDQAVEAMIKCCSTCVLNQLLNKYTPLQPMPLPRGPWVKGGVVLMVSTY